MFEEKKKLTGLFCDDPETPEGKYHVQRRDGTTVEWPSFVLGARDPVSPWALRAYAVVSFFLYWNWSWSKAVWRRASTFVKYRKKYGPGDPDKGRHRRDDPETIAKMRQGQSS